MTSKILVVDDDPEFCRMFANILADMDYQVSTATDGREGLAKIRENPPDILFLDLKMPHMGGLECLRRINKMKRKFIVVVMTGHADIASAREAMRLGADEYICKPFDLDELKCLMNELVAEVAHSA